MPTTLEAFLDNSVFISICLFFLTLTQRLIARYKLLPTYDSYGHLFYIRSINEQKTGPFSPINIKRSGVEASFYHPFIFHYFFSKFNYSLLVKYQYLINPFIDSLFSGIMYLIITTTGIPNKEALIILLCYIFSPNNFTRISIGPRTNAFTMRLPPEVFSNIYFFDIIFPIFQHSLYSILFSGILGSFVLLSSKFGVQAILFISIIASLIDLSFDYIYAMLLAIILTMLITKGEYIYTLKHQLGHLTNYFISNFGNKSSYILRRISFHIFYNVLKSKDKKSILKHVIFVNSYTATLIKAPVLIFIFYYFISSAITFDAISYALSPLVITGFIIFILINTPWLFFLGEAERYFNYIFIVILTLFVHTSNINGLLWVAMLVISYGIFFTIVEVMGFNITTIRKVIGIEKYDHIGKENTLLLLKLNEFSEILTILSYPFHAGGGWRILATSNHNWICSAIWPLNEQNKFSKFMSNYPYVDLQQLTELINTYHIDLIIVEKDKIQKGKLIQKIAPELVIDVYLSSNIYDVYRVTCNETS